MVNTQEKWVLLNNIRIIENVISSFRNKPLEDKLKSVCDDLKNIVSQEPVETPLDLGIYFIEHTNTMFDSLKHYYIDTPTRETNITICELEKVVEIEGKLTKQELQAIINMMDDSND